MTNKEAIEKLKILKEDYWNDDGYGKESQLYDDTALALDMAIKALKEQIVWHPYPKEKPRPGNEYLITYKGFVTGSPYVHICNYYAGGFSSASVTAWAEIPKPYEEGAENGRD